LLIKVVLSVAAGVLVYALSLLLLREEETFIFLHKVGEGIKQRMSK